MSSKLLRAVALAAGLVVPLGVTIATTSDAHAQGEAEKAAAKAAYKKGTIKYNLGEWQQAIVHFKAAFEAYPDASFLFNIAQSYRQDNDCKQGAFFYKRYLAIKPDAANKREVEGFIKDLTEACEKAPTVVTPPPPPPDTTVKDPPPPDTTVKNPPPDTTVKPVGDGTQVADSSTSTGGTVDGSTTGGDISGSLDEDTGPNTLVAYASLGTSFMSIGDLETPPKFNFTVGGGYPVQMGNITVDGGLLISNTVLNWGESPGPNGTANFTAFLLNVGAGMEVANKIRVRGELGMGVMTYSGLDVEGVVFLDEGKIADGTLASFALRIALGAEYLLTDSLSLTAQPIVGNFSPTPTGFKTGIDRITSAQLMVGVGYRM